MRALVAVLPLVLAGAALASPAFPSPVSVPPAEQAANFKAAGFARHGREWRSGACEPPEASYAPGAIETYRDLNGDGRPEAVVTEQGGLCYGMTGQSFWLLSRQADGSWRLLTNSVAVPEFLATRGGGGCPDISLGGPGLCFPVVRWNGREYAVQRHEYEGRRCRPQR
jgi:hypothetical protein